MFWSILSNVLPFAPKDDEGASRYVYERLEAQLKQMALARTEKERTRIKTQDQEYINFKECMDVMFYIDSSDLLLHVNSEYEIVKTIVKWRFITGK